MNNDYAMSCVDLSRGFYTENENIFGRVSFGPAGDHDQGRIEAAFFCVWF
jgi:hypothetical protein